jgi:hypothetical protein
MTGFIFSPVQVIPMVYLRGWFPDSPAAENRGMYTSTFTNPIKYPFFIITFARSLRRNTY